MAVIYLASTFAILQGADVTFPALGLPDWLFALLVLVTITGFPVALVLAWAYDVTRQGLLRADEGEGGVEDEALALGLRWAFAGLVTVVSVGLGFAAWWLWLTPGKAEPGNAPGAVVQELPNPARIAVLYFDDYSPGDSLGYLADGLTEGLIHELSQVEGLEVVSRHGVKPFRDASVSTDSIVRALRAGSLVEGSVTQAGGRLRVTVQLVDGRTDAHLASRVMEFPREDLFALQDSVTEEVARGLRRRLGRELNRDATRSAAGNVEAWDLLQKASRLRDDFRDLRLQDSLAARRALRRADELLSRAQMLDPNWVKVKVEGARTALLLAESMRESPRGLEVEWAGRALAHAEDAVEMAPEHPEAWEVRGWIKARMARGADAGKGARLREEAEADLRRALELDDGSASAWWSLSRVLTEQGRYAESRSAAERALEVDTYLEVDAGAVHELYLSAMNLEEFAEARRWCREGRSRFPREHDFVVCQLFLLASAPQVSPDVGRAWALVDTLQTTVSRRNRESFRTYGAMQVAKVLARAGQADSARAVIRGLTGGETPAWLAYDEAHARLLLGEPDRALDLLEEAVEYDPSLRESLPEDWWFRPLWGDPEFRSLMEGA